MATHQIGSGGDYADLNAWATAQINGVSLSAPAIAEVTGTISTSGGLALTPTTQNGHAITIRAASGQAFNDNANKLTNALRYNTSNGAALADSVAGTQFDLTGCNGPVVFEDLQIRHSNSAGRVFRAGTAQLDILRCIVWSDGQDSNYMFGTSQGVANISASVFYTDVTTATLVAWEFGNGGGGPTSSIKNSVFALLGTSSGSYAFGFNGGTTTNIYNSVIAGYANYKYNGGTEAGSHCATTLSALGSLTDLQASQTLSNLFENVSSAAAADFRVKAGSALIGTGTAGQAVSGGDIVGTAWAGTPCIGCWQYAAAAGTGTRRRVVFI